MSNTDSHCPYWIRLIFTLGLTALVMWLSLRTSKPSCSIKNLYIPALNKTLNSTTNTTINMQLELKNTNKEKGVYYDPLDITFYTNSRIIGNLTIPGFYQGHGKGTKRTNSVETHSVNWDAFNSEVANGTGYLRLDLATVVRYKILAWKTKRERLVVGANVLVNEQGMKNHKKGIKLKSGAMKMSLVKMGLTGVLVNIGVIVLLN